MPADKLWPRDKENWEFHSGRNAFQSLDRFTKAMDMRYGESHNIEEFAYKAQIMNYELMRPMFESFIANKPVSTGLIQWMLNSAWPEMYWQLYDSYLQPNGAFYATRKAGNRIHAIYAYGKDEIFLANNHLDNTDGLTVKVKIFDINSKQVLSDEWKGGIAGNTSKKIYDLNIPKNISSVWFLDIRTYDSNNTEIDNSFYWLSTKEDELDYKAAEKLDWAYYTPSKGYADFSALNSLKEVNLSYNFKYEKNNNSGKVLLTVENKSDAIAFFIRFDILDSESSNPILPIFWDDNYISLLPGESRSYSCHYNLKDSNGKKPKVKVKGYNVNLSTID